MANGEDNAIVSQFAKYYEFFMPLLISVGIVILTRSVMRYDVEWYTVLVLRDTALK